MRFHLITLFPDACDAYLNTSILGRARKEKKISVSYQNPRDFVDLPRGKASNKWSYRKVDERPYGGGPGMVLQALPFVKAVQKALKVGHRMSNLKRGAIVVWFSPGAKQFTNKDADALAKYSDVVIVCGRYEGIDERAAKILKTMGTLKKYSVGNAVYTGGEVPAMAVVDATTRRLPGILGTDESVEERRIASRAVYTRPETILYKKKKYRVPAVLRTGHHAKIDAWKLKRN